jgi:hypothetical protein
MVCTKYRLSLLTTGLWGGLVALLLQPGLAAIALSSSPTLGLAMQAAAGNEQTIATLKHKDLVHPTLSPNGKFLAYSEVIVKNRVENTAVYILDLATKKTITLIDPKQAAKYKTYGSFVSGMEWRQPDRLVVTISDGDVDSTDLIFNPNTRKLLKTKSSSAGDDEDLDRLHQRIQKKFPQIKLGVYELSRYISDGEKVILAGELFGGQKNVWLLDLQRGNKKALFAANDPMARAKIESHQAMGSSTLILLKTAGDERFLYRYRNGQLQKIQKLSGLSRPDQGRVTIAHGRGQQVYLIHYIHSSYEQGHNPLYVLDVLAGGDLRELKEYKQLYDVNISQQGNRIAYCYWQQGKRSIVVKPL